MISTFAGYVETVLDRVTESYADMREQIRPAPRVVVEEGPNGTWQRPGQSGAYDRAWPDNADVTLLLKPSRFLVMTLALPLGAKPYLNGVIASQIDRISPWSAERAIFGAAITAETVSGLTVRIAIAARDEIERLISTLGLISMRSLTLRVMTNMDDLALAIDVPFDSASRLPQKSERRIVSAIFYGVIALTILTELAHVGFAQMTDGDLQATRTEIAKLRETISGATVGRDFKNDPLARMINSKTTLVPTVEVLNGLAAVVPDETYLTAFEIEPRKIHIEGVSTAVTDLPKAIGGDAMFGDVSFSAPTAKRRDGAGETFQIDIVVNPRQGVEP